MFAFAAVFRRLRWGRLWHWSIGIGGTVWDLRALRWIARRLRSLAHRRDLTNTP